MGLLSLGVFLLVAIPQNAYANGTVAQGTTTVSRTSSGFSVDNPAEGISKATVSWITDPNEISIDASNAYYIYTPFSIDLMTTAPLEKGDKITLPLKLNGKIFNASSSYTFPSLIQQNNGSYYVSSDKNFSYEYSSQTGLLTITALTDAQLTNFTGMTYFLNNNWVPVPLTKNPYWLEGGVTGNYGAKGSGGTVEVTILDQTTSETVTNTADTHFSDTLIPYNDDMISRGSRTKTSTASSSSNFLSSVSQAIAQTNSGSSKDLLDGSYDHYVVTPISNAQITLDDDIYNKIRIEQYLPLGSNTSSKAAIKAIAGGLIIGDYPEYQNVIKNAKFDEKTQELSFDFSREPKDWAKMAQGLLDSDKFYGGKPAQWIITYLEQMAKDEDSAHDTGYVNLYFVSPEAYHPINPNFPLTVDVKATNSKSGATATQRSIVNPVSAGEGNQTMAGVMIQTVDAKGKAIGSEQSPHYYSAGDHYELSAPEIEGYQLDQTNPQGLIEQLSIPDVVEPSGVISASDIGKIKNVVFQYVQDAPITYTVIDDTTGEKLEDHKAFGTGLVGKAFDSSDNQKQLAAIQTTYTDKKYFVAEIKNQELPAPEDASGYDIEIHVAHTTSTRVVDGPKAKTPVANRTITQTVHYEGANDETPKDDIQTFTFKATVKQTLDNVTGAVIKEEEATWSEAQESQAVTSPEIKGFKVNPASIDKQNYQYDSKDAIYNVTYENIKSPITYSVIDDTSHKTLLEGQPFDIGLIGQEEDTSANKAKISDIKEAWEPKKYKVDKVEYEELPTPTDTKGYDIVFHVTHQTKENVVDGPTDDVKQTIHYEGVGAKTPEDNVQTFHFTSKATQTLDLVTAEVVKTSDPTWSEAQESFAIEVPQIAGYQADQKNIASVNYRHDSKDAQIIVNYKAEASKVKVIYRDVDPLSEAPDEPVETQELEGQTDAEFDNTAAFEKELKALKTKGYLLVKADQQTGTFPVGTTTLTVDLKHDVQPTADYEEKDVIQTIDYVNEAGDKMAERSSQVFHFTNGAAIDQVTQKKVADNWSGDQESKVVTSPAIKGYTADTKAIEAKKITPESKSQALTVVYKAQKQRMLVQYLDVNGLEEKNYLKGKAIPDTEQTFTGVTDEHYDHTKAIQEVTDQLTQKGYKVVKIESEALNGQYAATQDETITHVYLDHQTKAIVGGALLKDGKKDPAYYHEVKLLVHYEGAGEATPKDKTQAFDFESTVTYDQVTKAVLKAIWSDPKYSKVVKSPEIKGYKASQAEVQTVKFDEKSHNVLVRVTYKKPLVDRLLPTTGEKNNWLVGLSGFALALISLVTYLLRKQRKY